MLLPVLFALALLALSPAQGPAQAVPPAGDTVHTKDKKTVVGRVIEYERLIEVEIEGGKKVVINRADILKIEYAKQFIRCPDSVPLPVELLEKETKYEYIAAETTVICMPMLDSGSKSALAIAVDCYDTSKRKWTFDLTNRVGQPLIVGRTVFFTMREEFRDDATQIKKDGRLVPRDVNRLTLVALDLQTGKKQWEPVVIDNTKFTKEKEWWVFHEKTPPQIQVLPDQVSIRFSKKVFPAEKGDIKTTNPLFFSYLYTYSPANKSLAVPVRSEIALKAQSKPWIVDNLMVFDVLAPNGRFNLVGVDVRNGKETWRSEELVGRLRVVAGDNMYVRAGDHLIAYSIKNKGKRVPKFELLVSEGDVGDIDLNYVYYYRTKAQPYAILGYASTSSDKPAFQINFPNNDSFIHLMLVGHRLLYLNQTNTLYAYDTLQLKPMWEWKGAAAGPLAPLSLPLVIGSSLAMVKDARINMVDLDSGQTLWQMKGMHHLIQPVGSVGVVAHRNRPLGADFIRERKVSKDSVFFTTTQTPLRYVLDEDAWSIPAFAGDRLFSYGLSGTAYAFDVKEKKFLWSEKIRDSASEPLPVPIVHEARVAFNSGNSTFVLDPADPKKRHYEIKDTQVPSSGRQFLVMGKNILTLTGTKPAMREFATGKETWPAEVKANGVKDLALGDRFVYALSPEGLKLFESSTGDSNGFMPVPPSATEMVFDGKRIYVATGPYGFGEAFMDEDFRPIWRATEQSGGIILTGHRGSIAVAAGNVIYSSSDRKVGCYDPRKGTEVWSYPAPDFTSPLLVSGDRVWFAVKGKGLYGLNAKTGKVEWQEDLPDAVKFAPFVKDGKPAFWSSDGWMIVPGAGDAGAKPAQAPPAPPPPKIQKP